MVNYNLIKNNLTFLFVVWRWENPDEANYTLGKKPSSTTLLRKQQTQTHSQTAAALEQTATSVCFSTRPVIGADEELCLSVCECLLKEGLGGFEWWVRERESVALAAAGLNLFDQSLHLILVYFRESHGHFSCTLSPLWTAKAFPLNR